MFAFLTHQKGKFLFSAVSRLLVFVLSFSLAFGPSAAQAQTIASLNLPIPGTMVGPSQAFVPVLLKGMTIHPENPLQFDFIIDSGNTNFTQDQIKDESQRLVKYFLASMTIPKDDLWVNLSPYEKDRIIPDELGKTELGRDMLAQDYILKQLTASLMYPEKELGKAFWDKVYKQAKEKYGTTEIPVDTFNKVWILPETATVYEHGETVYIVEAKLKVMLDNDYVAMNQGTGGRVQGADKKLNPEPRTQNPEASAEIIREIILPEIEKEVNEGQNFAPLRQIYHSLILAKWYKETIKNSLLSKIYVDQKKIAGVNIDDATLKDQIYAQYMEAYKKGVFNYIKEDYDQLSNAPIPRKYFSGGIDRLMNFKTITLNRVTNPNVIESGRVGKNFNLALGIAPQKQGASSPILSRPWTLSGARKVLDNRLDDSGKYENDYTVIKAINMLGDSDKKNAQDIERLKKMLGDRTEFFREIIEKFLTTEQIIDGYEELGKLENKKAVKLLVAMFKERYSFAIYAKAIKSLKALGATAEQIAEAEKITEARRKIEGKLPLKYHYLIKDEMIRSVIGLENEDFYVEYLEGREGSQGMMAADGLLWGESDGTPDVVYVRIVSSGREIEARGRYDDDQSSSPIIFNNETVSTINEGWINGVSQLTAAKLSKDIAEKANQRVITKEGQAVGNRHGISLVAFLNKDVNQFNETSNNLSGLLRKISENLKTVAKASAPDKLHMTIGAYVHPDKRSDVAGNKIGPGQSMAGSEILKATSDFNSKMENMASLTGGTFKVIFKGITVTPSGRIAMLGKPDFDEQNQKDKINLLRSRLGLKEDENLPTFHVSLATLFDINEQALSSIKALVKEYQDTELGTLTVDELTLFRHEDDLLIVGEPLSQKKLSSAQSSSPISAKEYIDLGNKSAQFNNYAAAEENYLKALELEPLNATALNNLGAVYTFRGKIPEAIATLEKVIENYPESGEAYSNLANVYLVNVDDYKKAQEYYLKAVGLGVNNTTTFYNLATTFMEEQWYHEAEKYLLKAIQSDPNDWASYALLQRAYLRLQKLDEALTVLEKLDTENPQELIASDYHNLAMLKIREGQYKDRARLLEAERHLLKAIEMSPNDVVVYKNLGWVYLLQGKWEKSEKTYLQSLKADPNDALVYVRLAEAAEAQGKKEDAAKYRKIVKDSFDPNASSPMLILNDGEYIQFVLDQSVKITQLLKYFKNDDKKLTKAIQEWIKGYKETLNRDSSIPQILSEEFFRVTDDKGKYTGAIVPRDLAHGKKEWHRTVGAFVVDKNADVLIQIRGRQKKTKPGAFDVSAGGHSGLDDPREAITKEIQEEMFDKGHTIEPGRLFELTLDNEFVRNEQGQEHASFFIYVVDDAEKLKIKKQDSEVEALDWKNKTDFKEIVNGYTNYNEKSPDPYAAGFIYFENPILRERLNYLLQKIHSNPNKATEQAVSSVKNSLSFLKEINTDIDAVVSVISAGILQKARPMFDQILTKISLEREKNARQKIVSDVDLDRIENDIKERIKRLDIAIKNQTTNAALILSDAFIEDINQLLRLLEKPTLNASQHNEARAMAFESYRRLSSRDSIVQFRREKRPEYGPGVSDPENDPYNRVLEGVVQILNKNDYGDNIIVNSWGYTAGEKKKILDDVSERFAKIFFAGIVTGVKRILAEKGALTTAPPETTDRILNETTTVPQIKEILRKIYHLTDDQIKKLSSQELAENFVKPLVETEEGLAFLGGMQEKFFLYSAGPGTGKGAVWDAFQEKYGAIIDKLLLYHTRDPRKGEHDGHSDAYHFRTKTDLEKLAEQNRIVTALVNMQLQGLAKEDFEDDITDRISEGKSKPLPDDTKVSNRTKRKIRGLKQALEGKKPVVMEGGYGWKLSLAAGYPNITVAFISPFTDEEIQARAESHQFIVGHFGTDPNKVRLAYEEMANLVAENQREVNLAVEADLQEKLKRSVNELSSSPISASDEVGGIDMNAIDLDREGAGVDIQFDPTELQEIIDAGIDGFAPVIINITPLPSVLPLLGLEPKREDEALEVSRLN